MRINTKIMRTTTTTIHPAETTYMSKRKKNINQQQCYFEKKIPMPISTFVKCSATRLCLILSQQRTPPVTGRVGFFCTNIFSVSFVAKYSVKRVNGIRSLVKYDMLLSLFEIAWSLVKHMYMHAL